MRYLLLISLLLSLSCNSSVDSFYTSSHKEDIDVLPLLKPYYLWRSSSGNAAWHLDFDKNIPVGGEIYQMQVCKISIDNRIVFGHCMNHCQNTNCSYFVIVPDKKIQKVFDSKESWSAYLKENNVNPDFLYDVGDIYQKFEHDRKNLPWLEQTK